VKLPKIPEGRTKYLSPTELKAALEQTPERMRAPIGLAAFTGMRRGELLGLKGKDVDLEKRLVYLLETKNGTPRVLALNDLALMVIQNLPHDGPEGLVLADVDGQKLSVYTKRIFEDLNIEGARHSIPSDTLPRAGW
jgi:integrase